MTKTTVQHPTPEQALRQLRRRLWLRMVLHSTAIALCVFVLIRAWGMDGDAAGVHQGAPAFLAPAAAALAWLLSAFFSTARTSLRQADADGLAAHMNRRFPRLEESTQLLSKPAESLNNAQRLQQQRIAGRWPDAVAQRALWLPRLNGVPVIVLVLLSGVIHGTAGNLRQGLAQVTALAQGEQDPQSSATAPEFSRITITPPPYTALPPYRSATPDLELPEGSTVEWEVSWSDESDLALVLAQQSPRAFSRGETGSDPALRLFSSTINATSLYRLAKREGDEWQPLKGIHTLTVQLDQPPRLRILAPSERILEIPMAGPALFSAQVSVADDYGLGQVEIRASVAKGSGEGVKFRDEVFSFDSVLIEEDRSIYSFSWDLRDLAMAPGDEVYWFAVAHDQRQPEAQQARSDTVVVRWLDDAPQQLAAEGLAIDMMPDYFKSQRQIIIETEQLIADRDGLEKTVFDDLSRSLGQAQSDLKQRYGQYLGDEFEEDAAFVPAPENATGNDPDEDHEDHDEHSESAHEAHEASVGFAGDDHDHDHSAPGESPAGVDPSGGAAELIARFAHNHGAAEIGPITQRNPVGLMKRSISNMWQAELHLLLSDPERALPYEYEALKYLNLARQADRIYTRRLGFEPPPVTEERRLTGELDEIPSRSQRATLQPPTNDRQWVSDFLTLLSDGAAQRALSPAQVLILTRARDGLIELAQTRPALVRQAATLESMLAAQSLNIADCEGCTDRLIGTAWSLLGTVEAAPVPAERWVPDDDPMGDDYLRALEQQARKGGGS